MADAAELQLQLERLRQARASGAREVEYSANGVSRRTAWKSDQEMAAAIADLERQLARAPRVIRISTSKGLTDG